MCSSETISTQDHDSKLRPNGILVANITFFSRDEVVKILFRNLFGAKSRLISALLFFGRPGKITPPIFTAQGLLLPPKMNLFGRNVRPYPQL